MVYCWTSSCKKIAAQVVIVMVSLLQKLVKAWVVAVALPGLGPKSWPKMSRNLRCHWVLGWCHLSNLKNSSGCRFLSRKSWSLNIIFNTGTWFSSVFNCNFCFGRFMMGWTYIPRCSQDDDFRMKLGGLVVVASNAGGAWTPIGDITTTMLYIGGQAVGRKQQLLFLELQAAEKAIWQYITYT